MEDGPSGLSILKFGHPLQHKNEKCVINRSGSSVHRRFLFQGDGSLGFRIRLLISEVSLPRKSVSGMLLAYFARG